MAGKVVIHLVKQVFDVFVFNIFFHYAAVHYDCVLSQARVILSGSGCFFCTVLVTFKKRSFKKISFETAPLFSQIKISSLCNF